MVGHLGCSGYRQNALPLHILVSMQCTIISVGKKHDPRLAAAIEDYERRLSRLLSVNWKIVETKQSKDSVDEQKQLEGQLVLKELPVQSTVVLLDERGTSISTKQLAQHLEAWKNGAARDVVIIIGGAFGVSQAVMQRANFTWSLSALVFPHQLVRLILIEQLYRASSLLAGSPYHHE